MCHFEDFHVFRLSITLTTMRYIDRKTLHHFYINKYDQIFPFVIDPLNLAIKTSISQLYMYMYT